MHHPPAHSLARTLTRIVLNLCVSLLSLVLVILTCEAGFRILQHWQVLPVYNRKSLDKGETPNKDVNAHLVRSSDPVLFLEFDRKDPNINSSGFRGADFPPVARTPGVTRIAILGDSVAYGYSVPLAQTFPRLLEQKLDHTGSRYEVLNFAVCGYSTVSEVELYKTRVREYQPDIVLLAYVLNDPLPTAFVVKSVGAAQKEAEQFRKLASFSQLGAWSYLQWQKLKQPFDSVNNYEKLYQPALWLPTRNALHELRQLTAEDNSALFVAVFPLLLDFQHYPMLAHHQQIAAALSEEGIPHTDILDSFRSESYQSLRPHPADDTHPNAAGHALAAEQIYQALLPILQQRQTSDTQNR